MKIAVDGGAFQQGIAAGIYNVAVGLLNAMARLAPQMSFVFVVDPRIGPARPELLSALDFVPDIVEAPVGPAYGVAGAMTTGDPHVVFEIDGRLVPAEVDGKTFRYVGDAPRNSVRIHSRVCQPSASGSADTRHLGLGIVEIKVAGGRSATVVTFDDPRLIHGFHAPDLHLRWTTGKARLPQELFDGEAGDVRIEVYAPGHLNYGLSSMPTGAASAAVSRAEQAVEVVLLQRRLEALGCSAYLVNHFLPISFTRLKNLAILHDVTPIKFPHFFMDDARQNFEHVMRAFRRADHSFSVSESSRRDLIEVGDITPDRVSTIWNDIDPIFQPVDRQAVEETMHRYGLASKPYIICVGTIEPRKNHLKLLRAFLASKARSTHALILVGKRGWGADGFFSELAESGAADVRLLTDVPTAHLPAIYAGAAFLAYPSLYEGFGLPILEAMACGCPVLTSNTSSMAEIAEGAAVLVDPKQTRDIASGIDRLMADGELRAELRAKGFERRSRFSWSKSAARLIEVLER